MAARAYLSTRAKPTIFICKLLWTSTCHQVNRFCILCTKGIQWSRSHMRKSWIICDPSIWSTFTEHASKTDSKTPALVANWHVSQWSSTRSNKRASNCDSSISPRIYADTDGENLSRSFMRRFARNSTCKEMLSACVWYYCETRAHKMDT